MKRTRKTAKKQPDRIDPRITEALNKLDGALLATVASVAAPTDHLTATHNVGVAARAASDIRSILMLGGDES